MTYTEFINTLEQNVEEKAEPGAEVTLHKVQKNNGVKMDAITVLLPGETIAPAVYLPEYYLRFLDGETMDELAERLLRKSGSQRLYKTLPTEMLRDFDNLRHRIQYRLVNFQLNREFLKDVPYSRVLDLACIYYYDLTCPNMEKGTVVIRNRDLDIWNISQFYLQKIAEENTPAIAKPEIFPIQEAMEEDHLDESGMEDEIPMFILTNEQRVYGASCLLYSDVLLPLADKLDSDLFILPSSIHEVILTPDRGYLSRTDLEETVKEINHTQVAPYEVLSDHVYYYDRAERRILM